MAVTAEDITVSSIFSLSSYDKFNYSIGYELGYNQYFKPNSRLGIAISLSFKMLPIITHSSLALTGKITTGKRMLITSGWLFR